MTAELAATSDPEVDRRKLAVLLVDDHEVVHLGFRLMLTRTAWISRLVSARTIDEAVALACRYEPHVALVDLMLGEASGADACEAVRAACPKTRVLLMSGSGRIGTSTAQAIGASGFVPKDWATADILRAVYTVGTGGTMFLPRAETVGAGLSQRERNVLELVASGATNREIADRIHLSPHTVKEHLSSLYRKLGARNRADAVQRAQRLGLLS
ncbi:response regulator transcription factor [Capillimicrobium parvum]|uniref:DNA-binding transcriptional activator DevR/DosR n=1 Tax=Capillimicrobium parvum TaxID=2884022 RepID=A0A9E7C000_9ACTN|nr:response regulator transcription factor [Capillimicrobium parvum]UGS34873.1 DNA-binding transcriptional activator DevR/DosR [Capillimicrobium parvum]